MKVAIMQPYFLPYIGYFQLISAVDLFVVYDRIKYTKKGWINRNRMLVDGKDAMFSLPLKKDHDTLDVVERQLAPDFNHDKLLQQIKGAYGRAPFLDATLPLIQRILRHDNSNLFGFIHHSLTAVCAYLDIRTEIRVSSSVPAPDDVRGQDKVIAICKAVGARTYVNSIGGMQLYSPGDFQTAGIELRFLSPSPFQYLQFGPAFVPWLSILDVLMFNPVEQVQSQIREGYVLVEGLA